MSYLLLPHTFTFPFSLFNSLTFIQKKKNSLSWLFLYLTSSSASLSLSPLELPNLLISSINYLTFSSTSLSLSPLELPTSSSPQLIALPISYLNPVVGFFFSFPVLPRVLLLFESQKCVLSSLVSLFIFCCCIHLGALNCMSLWIKLYRVIVIFIIQSENIICHWKFFAHRTSLRLI